MTTILDQLNPIDIGNRLRVARESAGITQANASSEIGVARTTLVAIEKGQRKVRIAELQKLAQLYGSTVNALLRKEAIHVDLAPRFRKLLGASDAAANDAVRLMTELAQAEVELENLLGVNRPRNYPPERPIMRGNVRDQAEQDAQELRQRLGLGMRPIPDIITLLEFEMDVRVYIRKLDSRISGLFAFDEKLGPCILLNACHPRQRRNQSASHECGHFIGTRMNPEIYRENEMENSREERYANEFARAFLTPARAVIQKFNEVTAGSPKLTRRHVIVLAHYFGVSREAIVRRLEDLKQVNDGTWDWFEGNGGITDEQARQVLGDLLVPDIHRRDAGNPTTLRLNLLAEQVYKKELLSEGQLARLLHVDRLDLREMLNDLEVEGD